MVAVKIGRPGYRVTKQFDPDTKQRSLLFQVCSCLKFEFRFCLLIICKIVFCGFKLFNYTGLIISSRPCLDK